MQNESEMRKKLIINGKSKDCLFILFILLFGFAVWFFPKSIDSQKFLGFSDPLLFYNQE